MSNLRHPGTGKELLLQILKQAHPGMKHHLNLPPVNASPKLSNTEVNKKEEPK